MFPHSTVEYFWTCRYYWTAEDWIQSMILSLKRFVHNFYCLYNISFTKIKLIDHISHVMVSVIASSSVDYGFKPTSDQTKEYNIGICCFSTKHTSSRSRGKYCLTRNQDNVPEWIHMSIRGPLFQWTSTIKIQLNVLV